MFASSEVSPFLRLVILHSCDGSFLPSSLYRLSLFILPPALPLFPICSFIPSPIYLLSLFIPSSFSSSLPQLFVLLFPYLTFISLSLSHFPPRFSICSFHLFLIYSLSFFIPSSFPSFPVTYLQDGLGEVSAVALRQLHEEGRSWEGGGVIVNVLHRHHHHRLAARLLRPRLHHQHVLQGRDRRRPGQCQRECKCKGREGLETENRTGWWGGL